MNVKEILIKNGIEFETMGDYLATYCPFCEKSYSGRPTLTLNLDSRTGNGSCFACKENFEWEEIAEKFGISITPKEGKAKIEEKKQKSNLSKQEVKTIPAERFKKLKPDKEVTYEEWRDTIRLNFPELLFPAEVGLSIITQILIKDITNPFALIYVDVPSAGKTIVINFFAGLKELVYATDRFTTASFVSNAANVSTSKLKDVDLLPKLQYKMFLIRDMATIFSKREDELNDSLGILTRVLDGEGLNTESGVHGQRGYQGEYLFMLLAASTPIPRKVWKMMGSLGSRLFFLSLNSKDKSENELTAQLKQVSHTKKGKMCCEATTNFVKTLWSKYPNGIDWDKSMDSNEEVIIISKCAKLLARLRGVITVWKDELSGFNGSSYDHSEATIEKPDRISQLLYNECRGNALKHGRTQISRCDLNEAIELTIDSAPTNRARFFRKLIECGGVMKTHEVEKELGWSKQYALKEMETLKILEVAEIKAESNGQVGEPEHEIHLTSDFQWFTSEECKKIRNKKA